MKKLTKTQKIIVLVSVISVGVLFFAFYHAQGIKKLETPFNTIIQDDNSKLIGESLLDSHNDSDCINPYKLPKDDEYFSYKYDDRCYINKLYSPKTIAIQEILDKNYSSLYDSRRYFDSEIKKLHDESKNLNFLWHPEQDKQEYQKVKKIVDKKTIEESVINIGKYKLTVTSPENQDIMDDEFFYTHVAVTLDGKTMSSKDYKNVALHHIYKMKVDKTYYYLLGLCGGGMHGCGVLAPIVDSGQDIKIGDDIKDVDFSNYLRKDDFFVKNGDLYTVFDGGEYSYFNYSVSNNARTNALVPSIFKFDKNTGSLKLQNTDFVDLYKKSVSMIENDLGKLKSDIPDKVRPMMMQTLRGWSLAPYLDYYRGIAIISDPTHEKEITEKVKKLYIDFYGDKYSIEAQ